MLDRLQNPLAILYSLPAILVGLVLHELAHALTADRLGDPTPRADGRITLNPMAHLDFVGTIMLILFGFGWARPVRTNPSNYTNRRYGMLWVSLAGPMTNLLIAFVSMGAYFVAVYRFGVANELFDNLMGQMVYINLILFLLNLLPIPPLDGFNVLKTLAPIGNMKTLWTLEKYGFVILILLSFTSLLGTGLRVGVNALYGLLVKFYTLLL